MSVTVADLMKLPSLKQARVVAGERGLTRIVSSISVLESTDARMLIDNVFVGNDYFSSEIVITGFLNATDDVECQLANIRRLSEGGEVGLILFYVGVYMPEVDKRLIDFADEAGFVLIVMPEKRIDLRYGEVICEVMEAIVKDRLTGASAITTDILAQVSRLPEHQRTVDTVMRILSDRVQASFLLLDDVRRPLNIAVWPRSAKKLITDSLYSMALPRSDGAFYPCPFLPEGAMCVLPITGGKRRMDLLIIKDGEPLGPDAVQQSADAVQLAVNIWGGRHDEVALHELVRAILQDEPIKMRRLAEIFRIDIGAIHDMWVLKGSSQKSISLLEQECQSARGLLAAYCNIVIADLFEGKLLLFSDSQSSLHDMKNAETEILESLSRQDGSITLTRSCGLENTTQVREAYLAHEKHLSDAMRLFPRKRSFELAEIVFAGECRRAVENGGDELRKSEALLKRLESGGSRDALSETLTTYYLDCDLNIAQTAEAQFLHINTVKYRLRRISDALGFRPDKMPEAMALYKAVALRRMSDNFSS